MAFMTPRVYGPWRARMTVAPWLLATACFVGACGGTMKSDGMSSAVTAGSRAVVAHARIFFAHQSVGDNIVDGLRSLEPHDGDPLLNVVPLSEAKGATGSAFIHARLGQNGDPKSKTDAYIAALDSGLGESVDLAFQKYCFADFDANTDVNAVFAYYRQAAARIQAHYPSLTIAHVTAPLVTVQSGPRATIKKWIGQVPDYYLENAARERFNQLMRTEYGASGRLFDLAKFEASRPGEPAQPILFQGRTLYSLRPEYTNDGGHLNAPTQQRVATEFISFLGSVLTRHSANLSTSVRDQHR